MGFLGMWEDYPLCSWKLILHMGNLVRDYMLFKYIFL